MSGAGAGAEAGRRGPGIDVVVIGAAIVVALCVLVYLSSQRQQELRAAPSGFDGLGIWLSSEGLDARSFAGGWLIDAWTVGLNVVPVYDGDLTAFRERPATKEELLLQRDEYDLSAEVLTIKAEMAPTLVVLPKWRSGLRLTGLAHPVLLSDPADTETVLRTVAGEAGGRVSVIPRPFTRFAYAASGGETLTAQLYVAQVFEGTGCVPIIGRAGEMVLGRCPLEGGEDEQSVLVLSDPDLLNNHGLRQADNARIAEDFIASEAGGGTVYIDYSRRNWLTEAQVDGGRERTWADLKRFFAYPFSILWVSAALTMALVLWRAGFRFGPVRPEDAGPRASKSLAIRARARLLRLTGQDGALLSEYAAARLAAVAGALFGPAHLRHSTDEAAIRRHARQRDAGLAREFDDLLARIRALPPALPAREAIRYVDDLETILERLAHDT